jgi:(p)ppGpp synthase/HD superfamily hydrolase
MISSEKFADAIEFSVGAHKGQTRKGDGSPYIMHPLRVMHIVNEVKKKSKNIYLLGTCSMLHDTVEDCEDVTIEIIIEKFGPHVGAIVSELTLDKTQYGENNVTKADYLARHMSNMSSYALTIKLCDRLDNVSDMEKMDRGFLENYILETTQILSFLERVRKFTKTQKKIVNRIYKELEKY